MSLDFIPCRNVSSYYDPVEEEYLTDPFGLFALPYDTCQKIRGENWTTYCMVCVRPPPPDIVTSPPYSVREDNDDNNEARAVFFFFITILVLACFVGFCVYNIQSWRQYSSQRQNRTSQTIFSRPQRIAIRSRRNGSGEAYPNEQDLEAGGRVQSQRPGMSLSNDVMTMDEILQLPKVVYQNDRPAKRKMKRKTGEKGAKKKNKTNKSNTKEPSTSVKTKNAVQKGRKKDHSKSRAPHIEGNDKDKDDPPRAAETPRDAHKKPSKTKKKKSSKSLKAKESQPTAGGTCSICLEDFQNGDILRELPQCHHLFHTECLIPWLSENHRRCPMCTTAVLDVATSRDESEKE